MCLLFLLPCCSSYRKNIMFRSDNLSLPDFRQAARRAEGNYIIKKGDVLKLNVYTNQGERVIDPDFELQKTLSNPNAMSRPEPQYTVAADGTVRLPMVGSIKIEGLTLRQAEEMLQKAYSTWYASPYVLLQNTSNRVVVLGLPQSKVIPLPYENMTLTEVIALAGGLDRDSRADNIRIIRDDQFYLADLSSASGFTHNNMLVQPGDIIYIEPIRRPVSEALRDYVSVISILSSLTTLIIVVLNSR